VENIRETAENIAETPDGLCQTAVIAQKMPLTVGETVGRGSALHWRRGGAGLRGDFRRWPEA